MVLWVVWLSSCLIAGRVQQTVVFDQMALSNTMIPFTAHAPESFTGEFVRFVHVTNQKSAVATVVSRGGDVFRTNSELGRVIGITTKKAPVFVEQVY